VSEAAAGVSWRFAAFELDPTVPEEGVDARAYLEGKYDRATVTAMYAHLGEVFAQEGLVLRDHAGGGRRPNTFAAHRLLAGALAESAALQQAVAERLFRAFWTEGADVGDGETLVRLAAEAGMTPQHAREALTAHAFAAAVRAEERRAHELDIRAVPTFVFAGRYGVSGAQPPAVLAQALRQVLSESDG
jgi:predicted DsbA family dithiol-disulfide isomerase